MTKRTILLGLNLCGALVALAATVLTGARFLEPGHDTPVPQLAALGTWALPMWVIAGILLLIGRRRRSGSALVLIVALVIAFGVRWQVPSAAARAAVAPDTASGLPVRVLSVNTMIGQAEATQVMDLVRTHRVDVLVVQELTPEFVERIRADGIDARLGFADLHPHPGAAGTGIWSRWALRPAGSLPSAGFEMPAVSVTVPGGSAGPDTALEVIGIHTRAPGLDAANLSKWRADLAMIASTEAGKGESPGPRLYVGDFNASRDHSGFRVILGTGLVDAADAVPAASWPGFTWPAASIAPAFARIDHVLLTPASIGVQKVSILTVTGTDHHPVLAELLVRP